MEQKHSSFQIDSPTIGLIFSISASVFRRSLRALVKYELIFRLLTVAVTAPLGMWFLTTTLASSGATAVGNWDILHFLLTWKGSLALILFGILSFFLLFIEQAGIVTIVRSHSHNVPIGFLETAIQIVRALPRLLGLASLYFLTLGLIALPFLIITLLAYFFLLSGADIYYYVTTKPPAFWTTATIALVCLICFLFIATLLYVRWIFSIPLLMEGNRALSSLKSSYRLTGKQPFRLAFILIGWVAAIGLVSVVTGWALHQLGHVVVTFFGDQVTLVVTAIAIILILELSAAVVLSFIGFSGSNVLIITLFERFHDHHKPLAHTSLKPSLLPTPAQSRLKTNIWLGLGVFILVTIGTSLTIVSQSKLPSRKVAVTAHRGASAMAPENTLSAIHAAIDLGADFAEIDVQLTADGVVVVAHDADLKRVAGINRKIEALTYAEIKGMDVGSWFSPKFKGETIPSLKEVIEASKGRIQLNLDLKGRATDPTLVTKVLALIKEHNFESQCVLTSVHYSLLNMAKKKGTTVPLGFIAFRALGNLADLDVDFLSLNPAQLSDRLIRSMHQRNRQVHVWSVNTPVKMLSLLDQGVDNIITDEPQTLIELQKELASLSKVERLLLAFRNRFEN